MIGILALVFYLLDQATKFLVLKNIPYGTSLPVVPNFFYLVHVRNTGAAFGIFQDSNRAFIVLAIIALIVLVSLIVRRVFHTGVTRWAAGLLFSGIAGNLTDRLLHGSVVDFLDFVLPVYGHWPAFNVADSCISVAALLLIYSSLFEKKQAAKR